MMRTKNKRLCVIILLCLSCTMGAAQEQSTKEMKVVVIINSVTNLVDHLELMHSFQQKDKTQIFATYPKHCFYYGLLKGKYTVDNEHILPLENTTITIYTERQLFPEHPFYANEELLAGDTYRLGKTTSKVIANSGGELIVRTQKQE